jgi:hypothetical protein
MRHGISRVNELKAAKGLILKHFEPGKGVLMHIPS